MISTEVLETMSLVGENTLAVFFLMVILGFMVNLITDGEMYYAIDVMRTQLTPKSMLEEVLEVARDMKIRKWFLVIFVPVVLCLYVIVFFLAYVVSGHAMIAPFRLLKCMISKCDQ